MSHKRKGQLTTSGEWAKHLRPLLRRAFWKGERQAGSGLIRAEGVSAQAEQPSSGSLDGLLAQVESIPLNATTAELWVPEQLTISGVEIPQGIAMSILLDRLLKQAFCPNGFSQSVGGRLYRYRKE
jgi:hypothetical protein